MNNTDLPLTPLLQKLKDNRVIAKEFYKKYLMLCSEYNLEITQNDYQKECVKSMYSRNIEVPTWNLLKEQNDN